MQGNSVHRRRVGFVAITLTVALLVGVLAPLRQTGAQSNDLAGDYTVTYVRLQIPTDVANGAMVIGRWRLSFGDDGSYEAERLDLGSLVTGTYTVDGNSVTITDEAGLLSCSNAAAATGGDADVSTATYTFELDSGNLKFTPVDEGCALRRILLTTSDFTTYIPCTTVPFEIGTPEAGVATPVAIDVTDTERDSTTSGGPARDPGVPVKPLEGQIDDLLGQLTACWATGDPTRFLPLLSSGFQSQFLSGTEQENIDALASLQAAMQVPIVWERAGDVTKTGDDTAEVVVRTSAAGQEEFVRYLFVLENDEWRWDGTAAG